MPAESPLLGNMVPVHDPSLARSADGTYLVFDTDVPFLRSEHFLEQRCSRDLVSWHGCGYAFATLPEWVRHDFPEASGLWAPDISFFNGVYHLYYSVSTLGSQHSAIGMATSPTLDTADPRFHWTDAGVVLRSAQGDAFNAIDPNIFVEPAVAGAQPRVWLNFGSFWHGLFQQEIDARTGRLIAGSQRFHLAEQPAARGHAIEGSAMLAHGGWYYLFASTGLCCAMPIERDTYQQIVGRSRSVHGPFVAQDGSRLLDGGGTVLLSSDENWIGPGGGSGWSTPDGASAWWTFHALHRRENGALDLWVVPLDWQDEWPVLHFNR